MQLTQRDLTYVRLYMFNVVNFMAASFARFRVDFELDHFPISRRPPLAIHLTGDALFALGNALYNRVIISSLRRQLRHCQ